MKKGKVYFSYSGSGFEFAVNSPYSKSTITLCLKSELREHDRQYIAIYINDEFTSKEKLIEGDNKIKISLSNSMGTTIIKIIKLNETYLSSIYLDDIILNGTSFANLHLADKKKIGFFGDSITCGYGLIDYHGEEFKMETEDFTKTYAFLACQELGMDYTVIARSGISIGIKIWVDQLFSEIYDTVDMFDKCEVEDDLDYAVINLGANDNSGLFQTIKEENRGEACQLFFDKYVTLLKRIISDNPDVKLALCYNMLLVDDSIINEIKKARDYICSNYSNKCETLEFVPNSDGASSHPYFTAHKKAARLLADFLKDY